MMVALFITIDAATWTTLVDSRGKPLPHQFDWQNQMQFYHAGANVYFERTTDWEIRRD